MILLRPSWALPLALAFLPLVSTSPLFANETPGFAARPLPAAVVDAIPVLLDTAAKQKLMASGSYSSFSEGQPKVDLCPDKAAGADIIRTLNATHPNIGIQTLVVAAMPAGLIARTDRPLALYNLIHQFRTMEGLQYFSSTHNKVRTLFTTSHLVKARKDRNSLGDPHYSAIEPTHDLYLEQDDTTFGKNLYVVTVKGHEGGSVELSMSNADRVWWGLVPVLGPGALHLTLVIQASADGGFLYFYGNVGITTTKVFGMEEQVRTSFYNRVIALYNWFSKQAAGS
ncbi:DUF6675 family protein [Geothrix edaphica]|uniref:DUF4159 domain-containing protein n=1 Tax=Geothrix edaphica TaxID=2927976 RepID=A0ABQ5PTS6_9BACT|nr:DUF6675 family protein [Geothrix edaphica]GLH65793.1 hypothetical protein GETHED_01570 [Geothrix edaphica]